MVYCSASTTTCSWYVNGFPHFWFRNICENIRPCNCYDAWRARPLSDPRNIFLWQFQLFVKQAFWNEAVSPHSPLLYTTDQSQHCCTGTWEVKANSMYILFPTYFLMNEGSHESDARIINYLFVLPYRSQNFIFRHSRRTMWCCCTAKTFKIIYPYVKKIIQPGPSIISRVLAVTKNSSRRSRRTMW